MNNMRYLDLECLLLEYNSCSNSSNQSHTKNDAYQKACGYSTTVLKNHSKEINTAFTRGEDCLSKRCKELREKATELFNTKELPMTPLTHKQQKEHDKADKCHIWKRRFIYDRKHKFYKKLFKVKDHDHYKSKYRGAV